MRERIPHIDLSLRHIPHSAREQLSLTGYCFQVHKVPGLEHSVKTMTFGGWGTYKTSGFQRRELWLSKVDHQIFFGVHCVPWLGSV